jgi:hypothetical protein
MSDEEKKKEKKDDFDVNEFMSNKNDAREVREILEVVSTEIPKLLDSISKTLYNPQNAESLGKSVAQFYKQMTEAGMDEKLAYDLTQKFMANFSMGSMISEMLGGAIKQGVKHGDKHDDDDEDDDKDE